MGAQETAEVLQAYGGWGLSSILLTALCLLARYVRGQHEARLADQKLVNEKLLSLMETRVETDLRTEHALKGMAEALKSMSNPQARMMEEVYCALEELKRGTYDRK